MRAVGFVGSLAIYLVALSLMACSGKDAQSEMRDYLPDASTQDASTAEQDTTRTLPGKPDVPQAGPDAIVDVPQAGPDAIVDVPQTGPDAIVDVPQTEPDAIVDVPPTGPDAIVADVSSTDACLPDCEERECGPDGCGGECGPCASGYLCSPEGACLGGEERGYSLIPAGTFLRGAPLEEPGRRGDEVQHEVELTRSFYLKQTVVTQSEWEHLMGNNPSYFKACGGDCPVEQIAFVDALAFCNALSKAEGLPTCYDLSDCTGTPGDLDDLFLCPSGPPFAGLDCLGYRLPTEAEWEHAYRAGTTTALYNGPLVHIEYPPLDENLDAIAYYSGNSTVTHQDGVTCNIGQCGTHPVAQKLPNEWGLYDMAGNVWEWVWDRYGAYPEEDTLVDPLGDLSDPRRILRGGSWGTLAWGCRAAVRHWVEDPNDRTGDRAKAHGFRPARTKPE